MVLAVFLFLSQEDANHKLDNSVLVEPNEQIVRDWEKLDGMYVIVTGVGRTDKVADNPSLVNVAIVARECSVWSNPSRPVGRKNPAGGQGSLKGDVK